VNCYKKKVKNQIQEQVQVLKQSLLSSNFQIILPKRYQLKSALENLFHPRSKINYHP
jgi:hypothetical protein